MDRIDAQFDEAVRLFRTKTAVATAKAAFSYQTVREMSLVLAGRMERILPRPGRPIGIWLPNSADFVTTLLATWYAGHVAVPLDSRLDWPQIKTLIEVIGIRLLITDRALRGQLGQDSAQTYMVLQDSHIHDWHQGVEPSKLTDLPFREDHAIVFLTSGTTATPKIVAVTHNNVLCNLAAERVCIPIFDDEKTFLCMPLCHTYALKRQMLSTLCYGGHVYIAGRYGTSVDMLREICASQCNSIYAVPTTYKVLLDGIRRSADPVAGRRLRHLVNAAAAMTQDILEPLRRTFTESDIFLGYGLSEASPATCLPPAWLDEKGCSLGKAVAGMEVKLLATDGTLHTDPDRDGEIVLRGKGVITEYLNAPATNRTAFTEGYLRTGDVARVDPGGCFYMKGRIKDIINRAGEKIYPEEIEAILVQCRAVDQAAVVSRPHRVLGEVPYAFVTVTASDGPPDLSEVYAFCTGHLPPQKRPCGIQVVTDLPRTATGKVRKQDLIRLFDRHGILP